jgi:mRNA-degrading endonuclease RelE of RelBE toxin-antitoxin system
MADKPTMIQALKRIENVLKKLSKEEREQVLEFIRLALKDMP